jgi:chromosome segregation ATPase
MIQESFLGSAEATEQTEQVTSINTETTEEQQSDTTQTSKSHSPLPERIKMVEWLFSDVVEALRSDTTWAVSIKDEVSYLRKENEKQKSMIETLQKMNAKSTECIECKDKLFETQEKLIEELKTQLEKANQTDRVQEQDIIDLSFRLQSTTVQQDEVSSLRAKNAEYEAIIEGQKNAIQILTGQLDNANKLLASQQETITQLSMSVSRASPIAAVPIKEAPPVVTPPVAVTSIAVPTVPISGAQPPPPLSLSKDAPPPPPPMSANWKPKDAPITTTNQSNQKPIQSNPKPPVRNSGNQNGAFQDELRMKLKKRTEESENAAEVKVTDTIEEMKVQKEKLEKNQKEVESKLKTMTDELKKAELEVKEKTDLMNQHQSDTDEFKTTKNALDDAQKALKRLQKEFDKLKKDAGVITQNITISTALTKKRLANQGGGTSCDWDE